MATSSQQNSRGPFGPMSEGERTPEHFSWVWLLVLHVLPVKIPGRRCSWTATMASFLTCTSAVFFLSGQAWQVGDDLLTTKMTNAKKGSALNGAVRVVLSFLCCVHCVYCHRVGGRMLSHSTIRAAARVHAKSIFKINAGLLTACLSTVFIFVDNYEASKLQFNFEMYTGYLMYGNRVVFSCLTFLWTQIVIMVLLSACRTYTLEIRHIIRDLASDASLYDQYFTRLHSGIVPSPYNIFEEFIWSDDDNPDKTFRSPLIRPGRYHTFTSSPARDRSNCEDSHLRSKDGETESIEAEELSPIAAEDHTEDGYTVDSFGPMNFEKNSGEAGSSSRRALDDLNLVEETESTMQPLRLLSLGEILHQYWKISCRLSLLSSAFQHWVVLFLSLCFMWTCYKLSFLLAHPTTIQKVTQISIPAILSGLVLSAYAEVNHEGRKLLKYLCPTEKRLPMLQYLYSNPLQIEVFDYHVTYRPVLTIIMGLVIALSVGNILQEIR